MFEKANGKANNLCIIVLFKMDKKVEAWIKDLLGAFAGPFQGKDALLYVGLHVFIIIM